MNVSIIAFEEKRWLHQKRLSLSKFEEIFFCELNLDGHRLNCYKLLKFYQKTNLWKQEIHQRLCKYANGGHLEMVRIEIEN
jgi:hypothetical protein